MPDVRLIDGAELKKHIESTICYGCQIGHMIPPCSRCYVTTVMRYIDEVPEVDAHPVKRGKWETKGGVHCTRCGWRPTGRMCDLFAAYCAGCGAKMDGDAK